MKVLVTGARGQLGQDVEKACGARGIPCVAADSRTLDITDARRAREFIRECSPDAIINCAAYNAVDQAETEWERAFRVNGLAVRTLAHAARETGAVLVHYSTDYVFDGRTDRPYTIADRPNPLSRYGQSKLLGEQMVRELGDRYFLVRTSWVFGKGNVNFARKVLEWGEEKEFLKVVDDQVSAPTATADLARATLDLLETGEYGLYHLTNGGSCSRFGWARFILEATHWKGTIVPGKTADFPVPAARPAYSVLDNLGSPEVLGYSLPSWQDATLRYLKEVGAAP